MKICIPATFEFAGPAAQNTDGVQFDSSNWAWPGDAATASMKTWPANVGPFAKVKTARLLVVWNYTQAGTQLRLVHAASGPSDIQNLTAWVNPASQNMGSPIVSTTTDVAAALNTLSHEGVWRQLGIQIVGAGTINKATLEVVWEIDIPDAITPDLTSIESRLLALETALADIQNSPSPEPGTPAQIIAVPTEGLTLFFVPA